MREAIALHLELSRKHGDKVPADPTGYIEILDFEPEEHRRVRSKPGRQPQRTRTARTASGTR